MCGLAVHLCFTKINSARIMRKYNRQNFYYKEAASGLKLPAAVLQINRHFANNHRAATIGDLEVGCHQKHYNGWAAVANYHRKAPL